MHCSRIIIHNYSALRLGDLVQLLLSRGADPNASSIPLQPMFYAVLVGDVAVTRKLLECGARADDCLPGEVCNSRRVGAWATIQKGGPKEKILQVPPKSVKSPILTQMTLCGRLLCF